MEKKICPLMTGRISAYNIERVNLSSTDSDVLVDCLGEKCGVWNVSQSCCGLKVGVILK